MGLEGWITLLAILLMFVILVREWLSPDVALFGTLTALWVGGIVDVPDATSGFSSPEVLTVGVLFVVAGGQPQLAPGRQRGRAERDVGASRGDAPAVPLPEAAQ